MRPFNFKISTTKQSVFLFSIMLCNNLFAKDNSQSNNVREEGQKYNVLFITADDLNCDMGCFDDPIVKTPNFDRLRENAVRFNNAYCQYPLSGPSRASFMTGYSPAHTQVVDLETNFREIIPAAVTIPQLFEKNGYTTCRVGKIYHAGVPNDIGAPGMDDPYSWMRTFNPIGIDKTQLDKITNYTPFRAVGTSLSYMMTDGTDDEHTDAISANIACNMIKEYKDKPFFLALGFYRPHTPYIAPKKYFDMYPMDKITLPEVPSDDWDNRPKYEKFTDPLNWGLPESQLREIKRAYYATISFIDAQLGKVMNTLEEEGLADKTIIVFFSDHGYNLGQHGMWMKQALFEHTTRVPFIVSVPGMTNGKKETSGVVELLDVYPTLASICGLKGKPQDLDGQDVSPLLKNVDAEWDGVAGTMLIRTANKNLKYMKPGETAHGRSVRMDRYRYCEWDNGEKGAELYDYEVDPEERINFYNNPKYKKIQKELQKRMKEKFGE